MLLSGNIGETRVSYLGRSFERGFIVDYHGCMKLGLGKKVFPFSSTKKTLRNPSLQDQLIASLALKPSPLRYSRSID